MICILSLFGEDDLQKTIKRRLHSNQIFFIEDNCVTSVQLLNQVEARSKEVDAVIILSTAFNMEHIGEYVEELRVYVENLRVLLILTGDASSYQRSMLNNYRERNIDFVFSENGIDMEEVAQILSKGKLKNKELKKSKKESGFIGDIEEVELPESILNPNFDETEAFYTEEKPKRREDNPFEIKSFSDPQGHFTVGIMNAARGAGATWTANHLSRYFAMHNYKTCITEMSSAGSVDMMKLKKIDIYSKDFNIEDLKSRYNVTVIDFGTPVEVLPDGINFKLADGYNPSVIQNFIDCDIKLILGFSDDWNIHKLNFFFINDTWKSLFDNSYLFIVAGSLEKVKKSFQDGNFVGREDEYREHILEAFRKDEDI